MLLQAYELNKRADRLAAEAPFDDETVSKLYTEQEDSNVIQFYKSGEPVPVRHGCHARCTARAFPCISGMGDTSVHFRAP
jgi:hypothetical protein